jgi:hypothetical protein
MMWYVVNWTESGIRSWFWNEMADPWLPQEQYLYPGPHQPCSVKLSSREEAQPEVEKLAAFLRGRKR